VGRIEAGAQADFGVLHSSDWRDLIYCMGANPVREVWCQGQRIASEKDATAAERREREDG
jgi:imidazolonepropionase